MSRDDSNHVKERRRRRKGSYDVGARRIAGSAFGRAGKSLSCIYIEGREPFFEIDHAQPQMSGAKCPSLSDGLVTAA